MKNYWLKQSLVILLLVLFAFIANFNLVNPFLTMESTLLKQLIVLVSISLILFACNQLLYNYATYKKQFMQHPLWNKMSIILLVWLMISFVLFIVLFFIAPLQSILNQYAWLMFIVIYYFLFFLNLFILSIVHKVMDSSVKIEKKLVITWIGSSLLIAITLFMLPSI
ncbi:hypothetical protein [Sutcliffiella horikoshii]|uniref:hypothetical protein n=1 Tax=Sutcliffiella horikoshii TaxID=79883 RepID=UPI001F2186A9|nr:hypothetical protein [Sutcliffiella horikoshii]MCG1023393.1 hypothetical protein [Sutcliffiella horikoshii]